MTSGVRRYVWLLAWCGMTLAGLSRAAFAADPPATQETKRSIPAVGERAPDFELMTLDDKPVALAALIERGPVVVIVLRGWVGYQCPVCNKQVGDFIAHARDLEQAGASVALVYPGPGDELKKHAKDFESGKTLPASFSLLIDPDLRFVETWGLRWKAKGETAYPSTFVVNADQKIVFAKTSRSHGDRASAKQVLGALGQKPKK